MAKNKSEGLSVKSIENLIKRLQNQDTQRVKDSSAPREEKEAILHIIHDLTAVLQSKVKRAKDAGQTTFPAAFTWSAETVLFEELTPRLAAADEPEEVMGTCFYPGGSFRTTSEDCATVENSNFVRDP